VRKIIILTLLLILIVFSSNISLPSVYAEKHIVKNVPYYPMHTAICAIKALQMILAYYGYEYPIELLVQLGGWDYGIWYSKQYHFGYGGDIYPIVAASFAAKLLGFSCQHKVFTKWDEAWSWLKIQLNNNTPVFIEVQGHSIVAVGYDEDTGVIYIHDPSGGICSWKTLVEFEALNISIDKRFRDYILNISIRKGYGGYMELSLNYFKNWWKWMGRYEALLIKPKKPVTNIEHLDWPSLLERIASITIYGSWDPQNTGMKGYENLIEDFKSYLPRAGKDHLMLIKQTVFDIARDRGHNAAAFLTGLAQSYNLTDLLRVAWFFERASDEYGYASTLLAYMIKNYNDKSLVKETASRIIKHIEKAKEYEYKAGKLLFKVAKELRQKIEAEKTKETVRPHEEAKAIQTQYLCIGLTIGFVGGVTVMLAYTKRAKKAK